MQVEMNTSWVCNNFLGHGLEGSIELKFKYKQSNAYHTMFIKWIGGKTIVLSFYFDGIFLTGNDKFEIAALKSQLATVLRLKTWAL